MGLHIRIGANGLGLRDRLDAIIDIIAEAPDETDSGELAAIDRPDTLVTLSAAAMVAVIGVANPPSDRAV